VINLINSSPKFNLGFSEEPKLLLEKNTGKLLTTDEVDEKIYKKHLVYSTVAGVATGLIGAEIHHWKKDIPLTKKIRNRILAPIAGAGVFTLLAFQDIGMEKAFRRLGLMTSSDKTLQYQNRGYTPQYNDSAENKKSGFKLSDAVFLGAGAILGAIHAVKDGKIKLPVTNWADFNPKPLAVAISAVFNGLVYAVVGRIGLAVFDNITGKKQS